MTICIVTKRNLRTFEVLQRRWVVERTFAWISKPNYQTLTKRRPEANGQ
jgi:transposase